MIDFVAKRLYFNMKTKKYGFFKNKNYLNHLFKQAQIYQSSKSGTVPLILNQVTIATITVLLLLARTKVRLLICTKTRKKVYLSLKRPRRYYFTLHRSDIATWTTTLDSDFPQKFYSKTNGKCIVILMIDFVARWNIPD